MDGGTIWNINIVDAIDKCLDIVDDDEHIVVDVAITEYMDPLGEATTGTTLNNLQRQRQIRKYYSTMNDVSEFIRARPNVNYRHFFMPSVDMSTLGSELDFRNQTTW